MDRVPEQRLSRMQKIKGDAEKLLNGIRSMKPDEIGDFLKLDVLSETLDKRVGQVGRYERGLYFDGFQVLIDEGFNLSTLEPCWRAN